MGKNQKKPKVRKVILNPAMGGVVKTLKAGYYKVGCANFIHQQNFCASGVIEIWEDE